MTTFSVSNTSELLEILAAGEPGDVVELAQGVYSNIRMTGLNGLTFKPVSDDAEVIFSGRTVLQGSTNVTFSDIIFESEKRESNFRPALLIDDAADITIVDSIIRGFKFSSETLGSLGDEYLGASAGVGLRLTDSTDVTLENNEFTRLGTSALKILNSDDTKIRFNEFHDIRVDGISGHTHDNTLIEGNYFSDFDPRFPNNGNQSAGDHADMIQFEKGAIDNLKITGNLFFEPDSNTQAINGRPNLKANDADRGIRFDNGLTNFEITDNAIISERFNGIRTENVQGLTISNNTIVPNEVNPASRSFVPSVFIADDGSQSPDGTPLFPSDVEIFNNVVSERPSQSTIEGIVIQDDMDGWSAELAIYDNVVLDVAIGDLIELLPFEIISGNPLYHPNVFPDIPLNGRGTPRISQFAMSDEDEIVEALGAAGSSILKSEAALAEFLDKVGPRPNGDGDGSPDDPDDGETPPIGVDPDPDPDEPIIWEGTEGRDRYVGTTANEIIFGFGQTDNLFGGRGNDILVAGAGNDWNIRGGDDADTFVFTPGDDRIIVRDLNIDEDTVLILSASAEETLISVRETQTDRIFEIEFEGDSADRMSIFTKLSDDIAISDIDIIFETSLDAFLNSQNETV